VLLSEAKIVEACLKLQVTRFEKGQVQKGV
jgi:hypothetical protein